ncbi:MAG: hypothetical protein E5Y52_10060 [Mesorhizobium sp.]|nr:MAG: hypothetical protein E5Y52_10060 [Mesorhizobium sp.]
MQPGITGGVKFLRGEHHATPCDAAGLLGGVMSAEVVEIIQGLVDAETKGWDEKDIEPFLAMIHPDMAWPFAPDADAHDPIDWLFVLGRFDEEVWRKGYNELFAAYDLIHNRRSTAEIVVAPTGDALVDIDTLWRNKATGADFQWKGRICKIFFEAPNG